MEKAVWVYERKPRTCVTAGELLDQYEQVCRQDPGAELRQKLAGTLSSGKGSSAKEEAPSWTAGRSTQSRRTGGECMKCFWLWAVGSYAEGLPSKDSCSEGNVFCRSNSSLTVR